MNRKFLFVGLFIVILAAIIAIDATNGGRSHEEEARLLPQEPGKPAAAAEQRSILPTAIHTYEWQQGGREYEPGNPILFSDPNATIVFQFNRQALGDVESLEALYPRADLYYEEHGKRTAAAVAMEFEAINDRFGEFRVVLDHAPKRDLTLVVHGREGRAPIEQQLTFVDSFTAEWSGEDPYLNMSLRFRNQQSIPWWTAWGSEQRLRVTFSAAVDQGSADRRFADIFGGMEWSNAWVNERTAELTFRMDVETTTLPIHLNLNGVKSAAGYELQGDSPLQVYASSDTAYGTTHLPSGERKELFRTSQRFLRFLPNHDGTYALGQVTQNDETGASLYVLLDLWNGGGLMKVFQLGELEEPQWSGNDPNTFFYGTVTPEMRSVRKYEVQEDRSEEIWVKAAEKEHPFRWVRPLTVFGSERVWIMDYKPVTDRYAFTFSADLYVLSDSDDPKPEVTEDVHRSVCEGARCYGWFIPLSEKQMLMLQSTGNQEEPSWEYRLFDPGTQRHTALLQGDGWITVLDEKRYLFIEHVPKDSQTLYRYSIYSFDNPTRQWMMELEQQPGSMGLRDRAARIGANRFIIGDGVLDLERRTFERLREEPIHLNGDVLYWREASS